MAENGRDKAAAGSSAPASNAGKRPSEGSPGASTYDKPGNADPIKRLKLESDSKDGAGSTDQQSPSYAIAGPSTNAETTIGNGRGRGRGGKKSRGSRKDNRSRPQSEAKSWGARERIDKQRNDSTWKDREEDDDDATGLNRDGTPKLKKKKVAMLIGYWGLGYNGSQINPGVKTIEQDVFDACVKAGAISADNSDNTQKVCSIRRAFQICSDRCSHRSR